MVVPVSASEALGLQGYPSMAAQTPKTLPLVTIRSVAHERSRRFNNLCASMWFKSYRCFCPITLLEHSKYCSQQEGRAHVRAEEFD